jgi:hypothetical protein
MYDNRENIPDQLKVTSDEDEGSISDPELNVTSVEDGGNTLPIDSVNFMGTIRDDHDVARGLYFNDRSSRSHSSDEDVLCDVSTVDNDSIWDLNTYDEASEVLHNLDTDEREDVNDWDLELDCLNEELSVMERQEIFRKRIAHWAVESNILPKSYKTLLGTPRKVNKVEVSPGRYFEFNLLDGIIASLDKLNASVQSYEAGVKLLVGCDGMPAS